MAQPPSPTKPQMPLPPSDPAWKLDAMRQALLAPDGTRLALSGREMLLVEALTQAEGATVSRQKLASELGYADASSESRSLDAVVRRLRQKAQEAGVELPLKAVHAVGFRFAAPLKPL
jgi:DNA-binding response OmpR family regulator